MLANDGHKKGDNSWSVCAEEEEPAPAQKCPKERFKEPVMNQFGIYTAR